MSIKLSELAEQTGCELLGEDCLIDSVADIEHAGEGQLSFLYSARYLDKLDGTRASAVITKDVWVRDSKRSYLTSKNPRLAFVRATRLLNPPRRYPPGVSEGAVVADDVIVPDSVYIGPNAVIESGVSLGEHVQIGACTVVEEKAVIGDHTVIHSNVSIGHHCRIGKHCIIYAGTVMGADGFGYERDGDYYLKIPQLGAVVLEDHVEIGCNVALDRGALHDTIIREGAKIDNLVQIAHNVEVGRHTLMSGHSGIAGSSKVGEYCMIGGQVGIRDNIEVADRVMLTGRTLVMSSIKEPGVYSSGTLADDNKNWRKNALRFRELDAMARRLEKLEKALADKDIL